MALSERGVSRARTCVPDSRTSAGLCWESVKHPLRPKMGAFRVVFRSFSIPLPGMRNTRLAKMSGGRIRIESEISRLSRCFDSFFNEGLSAQLRNRYYFQSDFRRNRNDQAKFVVAAALLATAEPLPLNLADARHIGTTCTIGACPTRSATCTITAPAAARHLRLLRRPSTILCRQGAAAYIGQDRRRHPCY
jgi:hypothetical protein